MKNIIILSLLFILGLTNPTEVKAQKSEGEQIVHIGAGLSITGGLIKATFTTTEDSLGNVLSAFVNGGPALVLGYDIGISDRFSIGAIISTQGWNGEAENMFLNNGVMEKELVTFKLRRSNFSVCPKIHYGNGDNIDLYSGFRMGYVFWTSDINVQDPNYDLLSNYRNGRGRFTAGLTLFGSRFFINDNFAAHLELNLGAPFLFGTGLNYRLNQ